MTRANDQHGDRVTLGYANDASPTDPVDIFDAAEWIAAERLRLVYANLPVALIVSILTACVLGLLLNDVVSDLVLFAWLCAGLIITAVRFLDNWQFHRDVKANTVPSSLSWRIRLELGTVMSGMWWGYTSVGLYPEGDLIHQIYVLFILAGVSAGAMTAYSAIRRSYFLFLLPALLPLGVRFLVEGTDEHLKIVLLMLLFVAVVVRAAIETDRMIGNVLSSRAQVSELTLALQHQATHDALVADLVNHREFSIRLNAVAERSAKLREPYALLFIDLDHFKQINDSAGHTAGDETLRQIGRILKAQVRATDTAGRMGGDEFAVLLPNCPRKRAEEVGARVLAAIQEFGLRMEGGKTLQVGASIGIAYTHAGEHDAAAVLRAADSACYAAKSMGRNRMETLHADPAYESSGRFHLTDLKS